MKTINQQDLFSFLLEQNYFKITLPGLLEKYEDSTGSLDGFCVDNEDYEKLAVLQKFDSNNLNYVIFSKSHTSPIYIEVKDEYISNEYEEIFKMIENCPQFHFN